jgi:hypothetical protein
MSERKSVIAKRNRLKLYDKMIGLINSDSGLRNRYITFYTRDKQKRLLQIRNNDVVEESNFQRLKTDIENYCNYVDPDKDKTMLVKNDGLEVARYCFDHMRCLETRPDEFKLFDEPGYCFHRIPFLPDSSVPTPIYDDFISRNSEPQAVNDYFGSIIFRNSDRQQYLYLHGQGQDGKGVIMRFFHRLFGTAYHAAVVPDANGRRFANYQFINKRIVVFNEASDPKFPRSGYFKTLTGGDALNIEQKGRDAYTDTINCKFILTANDLLDLPDTKADMRRAIYSYVTAPKTLIENIDEKIWLEAPGILHKIISSYQANVVDKNLITIPVKDQSATVSNQLETFEGVLDSFFEIKPIDRSKPLHQNPWCKKARAKMVLIHKARVTDERTINQFFDWIISSQPVEYKMIKFPDKRVDRCLVGLVEREKPLLAYISNITDLPRKPAHFEYHSEAEI